MRLLSVCFLAALLAASAAGAGTIQAAGPVRALGVTGTETIFAAELGRGCQEVRVYDNADRGVRRYARHCWEATSTGSGIAAVASAGGRALWLTYVGGNTREWSLWTRTPTTKPRVIQFVARDVDARPPIVIGTADEFAFVYSVDNTLFALGTDGARLFSWRAPARIVASSAQGPRYAALLENGDVAEVDGAGGLVRLHDFAPKEVHAVSSAPTGLIVQKADALELRRGTQVRSFPLPPGSRLAGFSTGIVCYATARELRLLRLADGRDVLYRRLAPGFHAGFDRRGVAWATGRTVAFRAWVVVTSVFAG